MAIIYLHGFASSGTSPKVDLIRNHFTDELVVAPDLPPDPISTIRRIKVVVQKLYQRGERKFLFIGTSMGGFYAWYLSAIYDCPAILVNPAIEPHVTTKQWLGSNKNMSTGENFEWTSDYINKLEKMRQWVESNYNPKLIDIVVALDDNIIDALPTVKLFERSKIHSYEKGGHRFNDWDKVIPHIEDVYGTIREYPDPKL